MRKILLASLSIAFIFNAFAEDKKEKHWEAKWLSVTIKGKKMSCETGEKLIEFTPNTPVDGGYSGRGDVTTIYCIDENKKSRKSWTVQTYSNKPDESDADELCLIEEVTVNPNGNWHLDAIWHCDKYYKVPSSQVQFEVDKSTIIYTPE